MKSFTLIIKEEDIRKPRKAFAPGVKIVKDKTKYSRKGDKRHKYYDE